MASFNQVTLLGNLTRDCELKYTPKGTAVAQFGLAVNRKWKTESGELKEEVCFVDISAFGNQAENLSKYTKKGNPLFLTGRLKLDQWEDKQTGQKRSKLGVVLESFQLLGGKSDDSTPRQSAPAPARKIDPADVPPGSTPVAASDAPTGDDNEIPF